MNQVRNIYKMLFFLAISAALLFIAACNDKRGHTEKENIVQKEEWTCSMHPEIISDKPGNCPICGMDLIKKDKNATVLTGIKIDELLQPADRFVVSSIPLTVLIKKEIQPEVNALGNITYDTRSINTISARISGRIEKIYVQYRYQHIMKGDRIMDIYSPEMVTAEQELLFLIKNDPDNMSLISAAKEKLLLLGMNESQLKQIISTEKPALTVAVYSNYSGHLHEAGNAMPQIGNQIEKNNPSMTEELLIKAGMYIQKGQTIFQLFNTDKSWVLLNIFPEAQSIVKVGNHVEIIPETDPSKKFQAKIDFIEPFYRTESKTLTARVYFDNSKLEIPIGSQVKAKILSQSIVAQWLPKESLVSLGYDKVVFIKSGSGFKAHKVETGMLFQNQVQILSGLDPIDSVALNAQYLIDSEGFIKKNN